MLVYSRCTKNIKIKNCPPPIWILTKSLPLNYYQIVSLKNHSWPLLQTNCVCFFYYFHYTYLFYKNLNPTINIIGLESSQWAQEERSRVHISANVQFQVWPLRSEEDKHYIAMLNKRALGRAWNSETNKYLKLGILLLNLVQVQTLSIIARKHVRHYKQAFLKN